MEWSASFNSIKIHFIKWLESNRYPWNRKKTGCIWEEICILYYKCGQNPSMSSVPCTVLPSLCIDRFFSACVGSVICIWFGVVFLLLLFIAVLYCNSQTNLIYGFLRIQMMCYNWRTQFAIQHMHFFNSINVYSCVGGDVKETLKNRCKVDRKGQIRSNMRWNISLFSCNDLEMNFWHRARQSPPALNGFGFWVLWTRSEKMGELPL